MKTIAYVKCTCKHSMQDIMHGLGVRLCNLMKVKNPKSTEREVRCSVCSKTHIVNESRMK